MRGQRGRRRCSYGNYRPSPDSTITVADTGAVLRTCEYPYLCTHYTYASVSCAPGPTVPSTRTKSVAHCSLPDAKTQRWDPGLDSKNRPQARAQVQARPGRGLSGLWAWLTIWSGLSAPGTRAVASLAVTHAAIAHNPGRCFKHSPALLIYDLRSTGSPEIS